MTDINEQDTDSLLEDFLAEVDGLIGTPDGDARSLCEENLTAMLPEVRRRLVDGAIRVGLRQLSAQGVAVYNWLNVRPGEVIELESGRRLRVIGIDRTYVERGKVPAGDPYERPRDGSLKE